MRKFLIISLALLTIVVLGTSCSKEPKTSTVNVHVMLEDGASVPGRIVFYTDNKADFEKAVDPKAEKDALWVPSDKWETTDAQGMAKILIQMDKSKDMYFLVRHPLVNMYNGMSTFIFKGTETNLDFTIGE